MARRGQWARLRLLLWKDYLVRRRRMVCLIGVAWAAAVVFTVCIVRYNIDNYDYPTCQFAARALPSAGMLTFMQSFLCGVDNQCLPMERFQQIPTYENSTLTKLKNNFTPLLYNESVLELAALVPHSLQLLATLSDVVDTPDFVDITQNGLVVKDLFNKPGRVKRYLTDKLHLDDDVTSDVMDGHLLIQGIMKGNLSRCHPDSIATILAVQDDNTLNSLSETLCSLTNKDLNKIFMDLVVEINFSKYIKMMGTMYFRLTGDKRLEGLANTIAAVLRMTKIESFMFPELVTLLRGTNPEFSYFNLTMIDQALDVFKPTFGNTQAFKSLKEVSAIGTNALQFISKFASARAKTQSVETNTSTIQDSGLRNFVNSFKNAFSAFDQVMDEATPYDIFEILSKIMNLIHRWLPNDIKKDVLFYSTLLTKLIEGANEVVATNMLIEEVAYNCSLRHPKAVQMLVNLPPPIVGKGLDALSDAVRTQLLVSKLATPGQLFCDVNKLQTFFRVSKDDADSVKTQLCNNWWKDYVADLVKSFGIVAVKENINKMASLFIQDTLGKDTRDQLYSIDHDFNVLKNFTRTLYAMDQLPRRDVDWLKLLNVTDDSEFINVIKNKGRLGKHMLITIHGALAKEVVNQNVLLSYKIAPFLKDVTILVVAINKQLQRVPVNTMSDAKRIYPLILKTILSTALSENKTYKSLTTPSAEIVCVDVKTASMFLSLPELAPPQQEQLLDVMCRLADAAENGLRADSFLGQAFQTLKMGKHNALEEVQWTKLISGLKELYVQLDSDYPYLFQFSSYMMDKEMQKEINSLVQLNKDLWFGKGQMTKSIRLCVNILLRILDILDRPAFGMTSDIWFQVKYTLNSVIIPLDITDQLVSLVTAISSNSSVMVDLPPRTVVALREILLNIPPLMVDAANIIIKDDTDVEPIISILNAEPPWPCSSSSLSQLLELRDSSRTALRAVETIACYTQLEDEWNKYFEDRNATDETSYNWNKNNYQNKTYRTNFFLKFGSSFDSIIDDLGTLKDVVFENLESSDDEDNLTLLKAWKYAEGVFIRTDRNDVLSNLFIKLDTVVNSVNIDEEILSLPLQMIWERYRNCSRESDVITCLDLGRGLAVGFLKFFSYTYSSITGQLYTYFKEINDPNTTVLQILGFTKDTPLYSYYNNIQDYITVLLNSYFDYGFMTQVRRASQAQFWDCAGVVSALLPPAASPLARDELRGLSTYICPSLLYWISLPVGDNTLIDLVAKPQYYFYAINSGNMSSSCEASFNKTLQLADFLTQLANQNRSVDELIKVSNLGQRLKDTIDSVLYYKINETDPSYIRFADISKIQYATMTYLTRIVTIVHKLSVEFDDMAIVDKVGNLNSDLEIKAFNTELVVLQKMFKRRPQDVIAFHFDAITEALWKDDSNIVSAIDDVCDRLKNNGSDRTIVEDNKRTRQQICAKRYQVIYGAVQSVVDEDLQSAKESLTRLAQVLALDTDGSVFDGFEKYRNLTEALKTSINYAYDLSLPIYLKYLHSNVQHYNVILSLLSGGEWWAELRRLYAGPAASKVFELLENSFQVAEDFLNNPDQVHVVRLVSEVSGNRSQWACDGGLAELLPDPRGALRGAAAPLCAPPDPRDPRRPLLAEIPPAVFAHQGYNAALKLSRDVNTTAIYLDLAAAESKLDIIATHPVAPTTPAFVTDDRILHLRNTALKLLDKESLTKLSFGLMSNMVDAGTLFLNGSYCNLCSELTKWLKQLNLQLFKKQEYDNLVCQMQDMTIEDVYTTLKNEFHWDMAIAELLSSRNYTKFELNKSMNEFLEHVKLHLLDDVGSNNSKLLGCLAKDAARNLLGNVTLVARVVAATSRMFRAQLPHLHAVPGVTRLQLAQSLMAQVAPSLDVNLALHEITPDVRRVRDAAAGDLLQVEVNLRLINQNRRSILDPSSEYCVDHDCDKINNILYESVNWTYVDEELPSLQRTAFWRFEFLGDILSRVESVLLHVGELARVASHMPLDAAQPAQLRDLLDVAMQMLTDDTFGVITDSVRGVLRELRRVLRGGGLQRDLQALLDGLATARDFNYYLLNYGDLNLPVSSMWADGEAVERGLAALGVDPGPAWSEAAAAVREGTIDLKPIIPTQQAHYHISHFVCDLDALSTVVHPAETEAMTSQQVLSVVQQHFCTLNDTSAKELLTVLIENFNYTFALDKVSQVLLNKLYAASNLTSSEGSLVVSKYSELGGLLPLLQDSVGDAAQQLGREPLFQALMNFTNVAGLLGSGGFMSSAGSMLCGAPLHAAAGRFYKAVTAAADRSAQPDYQQLNSLPTEFCKSLYRDIVSIEGGKIVWSFVKPLLTGKILYAPDTDVARRIVRQANVPFAHMIRLTSLIHALAAAAPAAELAAEHPRGLRALAGLLPSAELTGAAQPDHFIEGLGDVKGFSNLLRKGSDLLRCVNLDRFRAMPDEQALTHEAAKLTVLNDFSAGIVFLNTELGENGKTPNIEYKIRMDIENVPTTKKIKNYLWTPGPESSFIEDMRYFRGFVQIQNIIDKAVIDLVGGIRHKQKRAADSEPTEAVKWDMYTQQIPYPCYRKDFFQTSLYESQALLVTFFFAFLFTVCSVVRFVVHDKQTLNTMLMSIMGVEVSLISLSWFLISLLEMVATCAVATAVLWAGGVLPGTEPWIIFGLLAIFGFSTLCFCYMVSRVLGSASLAAVLAGVLYLVSFMPVVVVLALETTLTSHIKYFMCLSMSSSLCYAFLFVARFEATGLGCGWDQLWTSPIPGDNMSIAAAAMMMLVDGILYLLVAAVLEKYFGVKTVNSNITMSTSTEKAGVSIVNVTKIYGRRSRKPKLALDGVSIELRQGQVTTLLGHNGAGKTTLIKIITGMCRATSGSVSMVTSRGGPQLGLCPQHDVLFDALTAAEHLVLYARLKTGLGETEVREEVDSMLRVLCLGGPGDVPAGRLSGGTRRRLAVALAFVAAPALVTLDEPTAAVDPAARRDIWQLIGKLKANRTVLMSTHHLDEAELLSDQIVIMHKGQVHTTGSPMEIKRTLGTGYKLVVSYPRAGAGAGAGCEQLVAAVRGVIKNASVLDAAAAPGDVHFMLPYFDENGCNNDYLTLCTTLESLQASLGFSHYSVDCSSLEQVFYNVCNQDTPDSHITQYEPDAPCKSNSTSSVKTDLAPLVPAAGPLRGSSWQQMKALLYARYLHYTRNSWLLFLVVCVPSMFVLTAMAFSTIRPPADNEISLKLNDDIYNATQFAALDPSVELGYSQRQYEFAQRAMNVLAHGKLTRNWSPWDNPICECSESRQHCSSNSSAPETADMVLLPDVDIMNQWLVTTQEQYIENRYIGFSSVVTNTTTHMVAWYNNKGHHALPAAASLAAQALLRAAAADPAAGLAAHSHPMKITAEQINRNTLYQHVADAGISCLLLVAYSLVSAGGAIYVVAARRSQQQRLQRLCGLSPALYWAAALLWDLLVIAVNMVVTACILQAFGFQVFVYRQNLAAICLLILLYGFACGGVVHVWSRVFADASFGNMALFCGNVFAGLAPTALLLVLDLISASDATDNARWVLHKVFMVLPQFVLTDGLLEISKNTIQAQVLSRFGMDTYRPPLWSDLLLLQYCSLAAAGALLFALKLLLEYGYLDLLLARFEPALPAAAERGEAAEVREERRRVTCACAASHVRLNTIGNVNAGFEDSEKRSHAGPAAGPDVLSCVELSKVYRSLRGRKLAVNRLTVGIPPAQCLALLGQNGAGKSTTFKLLTGELRASAGHLYLRGAAGHAAHLAAGHISYCPQTNALDPLLTVEETLRMYCRLRGIDNEDQVISGTLQQFGLGRYRRVRCAALSGGNQRKLCCAVALMSRASLVLLDEPTSGMDPVSRGVVVQAVGAACAAGAGAGAAAGGRAVLLSTHALSDAAAAHSIALMHNARLLTIATRDHYRDRFGGGVVVWIACGGGGGAASTWRALRRLAPAARLRALQPHALCVLLPPTTTVDGKEVSTKMSDAFRLMAKLQASCDVLDYTINQTSLDEMFLSFANRSDDAIEDIEPSISRRNSDDLQTVTSL